MATYDYKCDKCGVYEVVQSMKEDAYKTCPKCGSEKIERLISGEAGSAIAYKAKGFYKTDYKKLDGAFNKYLPKTE